MSKYVQINGWWGSGKGLLFGYLDGHPSIAPNPIHDSIQMLFMVKRIRDALKSRDLQTFRNNMNRSAYYLIERYALEKKVFVPFGSGKVLHPPFEFDFPAFNKSWPLELLQREEWIPEEVLLLIYSEYAYGLTGKRDWDYYYSLGTPFLYMQKNFHSELPSSRSILVRRSVEQIIATRTGRKALDIKPTNSFAPGFETMIKEGEVRNIIEYYSFWDQWERMRPDLFMSVNFDDLFTNKEAIVRNVSDFLGIPFKESLLKWTFMGQDLRFDGMAYDDQVFDKPEDLLTEAELKIIQNEIDKFHRKGMSKFIHKLAIKASHLVKTPITANHST